MKARISLTLQILGLLIFLGLTLAAFAVGDDTFPVWAIGVGVVILAVGWLTEPRAPSQEDQVPDLDESR